MSVTSVTGAVVALAAIVASIVVLGRVASRFRLPFVTARDGGRLSIRTSFAIDAKRRLIIVACDGRESLLLLGPHGDLMLGCIADWRDPAP